MMFAGNPDTNKTTLARSVTGKVKFLMSAEAIMKRCF